MLRKGALKLIEDCERKCQGVIVVGIGTLDTCTCPHVYYEHESDGVCHHSACEGNMEDVGCGELVQFDDQGIMDHREEKSC